MAAFVVLSLLSTASALSLDEAAERAAAWDGAERNAAFDEGAEQLFSAERRPPKCRSGYRRYPSGRKVIC